MGTYFFFISHYFILFSIERGNHIHLQFWFDHIDNKRMRKLFWLKFQQCPAFIALWSNFPSSVLFWYIVQDQRMRKLFWLKFQLISFFYTI